MQTLRVDSMSAELEQRIAAQIGRERGRLRSFIRRRVADPGEVEDILQEVFSELVEAYRLMKPVEQVGAWLFRVARNRIIDRFRKRREEPSSKQVAEDGEVLMLEELLPSPDAGPDAAYARSILLGELEDALQE